MGDASTDLSSSLLAHEQEDTLWDQEEQGGGLSTGGVTTTVDHLLWEKPNQVLKIIQRSVSKLGDFSVPDYLVFGRLGDDSIVTFGAETADLNFHDAWLKELRQGSKFGRHAPPESETCGWSTTIPVKAYVVNIAGAGYRGQHGLLQPLLRRWQAGGCSYSVFALPAVQSVIDFKWETFCKKLLLIETACFLIWMAAFYVFVAFFQDEDTSMSLLELLQTTVGKITVSCNFIALIAMLPFVIIEVGTVLAYGLRGWATVWNLLDITTYALQIAIVAMHISRFNVSSGWLSIAAAAQCILLLFRLQYFSRVFTPTRFAFLDDFKEVLQDVRWYLVFISILVLGYAAAFQIIFRSDQKAHPEYRNLGRAFIQMVTWSAGNADLSPLYSHSQNPIAACILGVSFVFILGMVLLNLLIGLMTNSLDKVTQNEGVRLMLSKAQAIDEIEAVLPGWVRRKFSYFWPKFIHVLRVDPEKLDAVKTDQLWASRGDDEHAEVLLGGGQREEEEEGPSGSGKEQQGQEVAQFEGLQQQISELVKELRALRQVVEVQQQKQMGLIEEIARSTGGASEIASEEEYKSGNDRTSNYASD